MDDQIIVLIAEKSAEQLQPAIDGALERAGAEVGRRAVGYVLNSSAGVFP